MVKFSDVSFQLKGNLLNNHWLLREAKLLAGMQVARSVEIACSAACSTSPSQKTLGPCLVLSVSLPAHFRQWVGGQLFDQT